MPASVYLSAMLLLLPSPSQSPASGLANLQVFDRCQELGQELGLKGLFFSSCDFYSGIDPHLASSSWFVTVSCKNGVKDDQNSLCSVKLRLSVLTQVLTLMNYCGFDLLLERWHGERRSSMRLKVGGRRMAMSALSPGTPELETPFGGFKPQRRFKPEQQEQSRRDVDVCACGGETPSFWFKHSTDSWSYQWFYRSTLHASLTLSVWKEI